MISVYITCKDEKEAKRIAKTLLEKRLVACANIFPVESMYWWQGRIQDEKEYAVIAKSREERFSEIKEEARRIHSYEIPCIVSFKIDGDEEYLKWIKEETR